MFGLLFDVSLTANLGGLVAVLFAAAIAGSGAGSFNWVVDTLPR